MMNLATNYVETIRRLKGEKKSGFIPHFLFRNTFQLKDLNGKGRTIEVPEEKWVSAFIIWS